MERSIAGAALVLVLIAVAAGCTRPGRATDVAVMRLEARPYYRETTEYVCKRDAYVTGDLVGDGNPAEVYARLCP
jgi:hypothetical protein